jgi:hypothetical protein
MTAVTTAQHGVSERVRWTQSIPPWRSDADEMRSDRLLTACWRATPGSWWRVSPTHSGYWNRASHAAADTIRLCYACALGDVIVTPLGDMLTLSRLTVNPGLGIVGLAGMLRTRSAHSRRSPAAMKQVTLRGLLGAVAEVRGNSHQGRLA